MSNESEPSEEGQREVTVDDFTPLKVLGRGGLAKVMLCREKATNELLAMKILKKHTLYRIRNVYHAAKENKVLKLIDHPFLTRLKYSFQNDERIFFITEYAAGGEMYMHLQKLHRFSEHIARIYGAELILAIAYLHSKGIVYRDLKLENILLDREGHLKLCDFGLAKCGLTGYQTTTTFCGTTEYMAPELLLSEPYTKAVDWWGTGAVMLEWMHGFLPFIGETRSETIERILIGSLTYGAHLSADAVALLTGLLQKNPERRLGAGPNDAEEIKIQRFFYTIDWSAIEQKKIQPPIVPFLKDEVDTGNFDQTFANDEVALSPIEGLHLDVGQEFFDFDYQSPF